MPTGTFQCALRVILLLSMPLLIASHNAQEIVVIVNPASGVETLSRQQVVNIFMGRSRELPSGLLAFPIDIGDRSVERRAFYHQLLNKELAEIDAYWARLVFSGRTSPPLRVPDGATALLLVAGNRSAIAYVDQSLVDGRVRVVLSLAPGER